MGLRDILLNIESVANAETDREAVLHRITQINAIISEVESLSNADRDLLVKTRGKLNDLYHSNLPLGTTSLLALLVGKLVSKHI